MGQPCESSHTKDEDDNDELCPMAGSTAAEEPHEAGNTNPSLSKMAGGDEES